MKLSDRIQEQIDFLKLPTTVWRQGAPARENEACAVVRRDSASHQEHVFNSVRCLPAENRVIQDTLRSKYISAINGSYCDLIEFNDRRAKSKEEVIEVLKAIRDNLIAEDL